MAGRPVICVAGWLDTCCAAHMWAHNKASKRAPSCSLGGCTHSGANVPSAVVVRIVGHQHDARSIGNHRRQVHQRQRACRGIVFDGVLRSFGLGPAQHWRQHPHPSRTDRAGAGTRESARLKRTVVVVQLQRPHSQRLHQCSHCLVEGGEEGQLLRLAAAEGGVWWADG